MRLIQASRYIDALFVRQRSAGLESTLLQLLSDETPLGRARLSYFLLNKGPWSELDEDRAVHARRGAEAAQAEISIPPMRRARKSTRG